MGDRGDRGTGADKEPDRFVEIQTEGTGKGGNIVPIHELCYAVISTFIFDYIAAK